MKNYCPGLRQNPSEIAQLLRFDIPYFTRILGQNQLQVADAPTNLHMPQLDFASLHDRLQQLQDPAAVPKALQHARTALDDQNRG